MNSLRIITLEEHFAPPVVLSTSVSNPPVPHSVNHDAAVRARVSDIETIRLPEMDAAGISMQILSINGGSIDPNLSGESLCSSIVAHNDAFASIVASHPDRFAAFATLPCQYPDKAAAELQRSVTKLGFKGALVRGHANGEYLDAAKFWPIWECAEALDVPVYLHPAPPPDVPHCLRGYEELQGAAWGWAIDTGSHALRLVAAGLFDRYPRLRLILGHMGEGIPFTLWRLDDRWATHAQRGHLERRPSEYIQHHFYVTTAGVPSFAPLQCTMIAMGADHVLFSVDYPHQSLEEPTEFIRNVPISESDRQKIAYANAEQLLKL